jgi:hypothetical protein
MQSAICLVTQRHEDMGMDPATRAPKQRIWWELTTLRSWPARTPVSVMVSEIRRMHGTYAVNSPQRFNAISVDRDEGSAIIRGFRRLLEGTGIRIRPLPITEEGGERPCVKREDLLFELSLAVDQGRCKIPPSIGEEFLLPLDAAVRWGSSDADLLGRVVSLTFWSTGLLEPGERAVSIVA